MKIAVAGLGYVGMSNASKSCRMFALGLGAVPAAEHRFASDDRLA